MVRIVHEKHGRHEKNLWTIVSAGAFVREIVRNRCADEEDRPNG